MSPDLPLRVAASPTGPLTTIDLVWEQGRREQWIRFGHAVAEEILDRRWRRLSYAPGTVVAFVRWAANERGTVLSRLDILSTVGAGEGYATTPGVDPGADPLLRQSGWPRVQAALQIIDGIEAAGLQPADIAPDYWRHVHHRLCARLAPEVYSPARHRAWRLRQALGA